MFIVISAVQVYLRAGWKLGNVQDRYIFAGPGGDQIVGRAVAGLPTNDRNFAILPPHFTLDDVELINTIGWENIMHSYASYPSCFRRVIPFLLASILFHLDWLKENLSDGHPLWNSRLFVNHITVNVSAASVSDTLSGSSSVSATQRGPRRVEFITHFKSRVLTGCGRCVHTGMQATGIPPHLVISNEIAELREMITTVGSNMSNQVHVMQTEILNGLTSLPGLLKESLMENFQIDGVSPLSRMDVENLIDRYGNALRTDIRGMLDAIPTGLHGQHLQGVPQLNASIVDGPVVSLFCRDFVWPGELGGRWVPHKFVFPSGTLKEMWNLWHYGNTTLRVVPYKLLHENGKQKDLVSEKNRTQMSRTHRVMSKLHEIAVEHNIYPADTVVGTLSLANSDSVYQQLYPLFIQYLYNRNTAPAAAHMTKLNSYCNQMTKLNKVTNRVAHGGGNDDNMNEDSESDG
jgi:hypothetical protein